MSAPILTTRSNTISGIKFQTINDIPNLQLWLDASDANSFLLSDTSVLSSNLALSGDENWRLNNSSRLQLSQTLVLTGDFTAECWIRKEQKSPNGYSMLFSGDGSAGLSNCQISIDWTTEGRASILLNAGGYHAITTTTPISTNVWQHIAYVREGSVIGIYVDGISQPLSVTGSPSTTTARIKNLNHWHEGGYGFIGLQTNMRVVNGKALYTTNFNPYISASIPLQPISEPNVTTPVLALQDVISYTNNSNVQNVSLTPSGTFRLITPHRSLASHWLDKSPNSLTAIQTNIDNQCVFLSGENNNLSFVHFDGSDDCFDLSNSIDISRNYSHFFVYGRPANGFVSTSLGNRLTDEQSCYLHAGTTELNTNTNRIHSSNTKTNSTILSTDILIGGLRKNQYLQVNLSSVPFATSWLGTKTNTVSSLGIFKNLRYHGGPMYEIVHTECMLPDYEVDLVNKKLINKWR